MGQHQSAIDTSGKRLSPIYYYGPDRKTIMKKSKKNVDTAVGVLDEEYTYARMESPESPDSGVDSPPMEGMDESPSTSDSTVDSNMGILPSDYTNTTVEEEEDPRPRQLVLAPFKDIDRRRALLSLPPREEVVPAKRPRQSDESDDIVIVETVVKRESADIYDCTSLRQSVSSDSGWKTPQPIATSTPIPREPKRRVRPSQASSFPTQVNQEVDMKPDMNVLRLAPSPPVRTSSLQQSCAERGFPPRRLSELKMAQLNPQMPQFGYNIHPMHQQMLMMQQQQIMQLQAQQRAAQGMQTIGEQTVGPLRSAVSSSNVRPLFTPLANQSASTSQLQPAPRPAMPQMGLTPRRVKKRVSTGESVAPAQQLKPVPILSNPQQVVNGMYTSGFIPSSIAGQPTMPPPMYNPTMFSYSPRIPPNQMARPQLPLYPQMYPMGYNPFTTQYSRV